MDKLCIGARARRKRKVKQALLWTWALSTAGSLAGLPLPSMAVSMLDRFDSGGSPGLRGVETSESAAALMRFRRVDFRPEPSPTKSPSPPAPAEQPVAEPAAPAPDGIAGIIYAAAAEYGLDGAYLLSVADCESSLDPNAVNPAGYHGLFQFDETTWAANGYGSIYDPVAQSRTAARLIAAGQASRWPNCA